MKSFTTSRGQRRAYSFTFCNGSQLTVTPSQLMVIWMDEMPYFARVDQVKVGSIMRSGKIMVRVTNINRRLIDTAVGIETDDGTVQINGVLASSFCDYRPRVVGRTVRSK